VRLVRVLRLIGELRTMVVCILNSLRSLVWTVALLLLLMYVIAVYLTQVVSEYRREQFVSGGAGGRLEEDLDLYFGSLLSSILTLYQAISGGLSWNVAVLPLMSALSPFLGFLFSFYVAFVLIAIMNVVTAVFVESALKSAQRDTDVYMVHSVHDAFVKANVDMEGSVTWQEFQHLMETSQMKETFKVIDIDREGASELFHLLDTESTGRVMVYDIVNACIKANGAAKSIDLITLMSEHRRLARRWSLPLDELESCFQKFLPAASRPHSEASCRPSTALVATSRIPESPLRESQDRRVL